MKTLLKHGLLAAMLLTAATSAYAINNPTNLIGYSPASSEVKSVPEPMGLALLGMGLVILAVVRRKK